MAPALGRSGAETSRRLMADLQKDFGYTKEQAAGIVGSLSAETGGFKFMQELRPRGGRGGYGFAQWTGPRRRAFEKWAANNGLDINSYEANYGFLKHEMQTDPTWRREAQRVKGARTVEEAARTFTGSAAERRGFLRPGVPHYGASISHGRRAFAGAGKEGAQVGADYGSREGLRPGPGMGLPGGAAEAPIFENVASKKRSAGDVLREQRRKQENDLMWGHGGDLPGPPSGREGLRPGPGGGLLDVPDPVDPWLTKRQRRELAKRYFEQNPWGPGRGEGEAQPGEGPSIDELNAIQGRIKPPPLHEELINRGYDPDRKHDQLVSLRTKNLFASRGGSGASYALGDVSNDNSRKMDQQNTFNTTIHTSGDTREAGRLLTRANEQTALLLQNRGAIV